MADILYLRDYKSREQREIESAQAEQRRFEHETRQSVFEGDCFPFAADGGPVILTCQNGETLHVHRGVEPPADCPA